MNTTVLMVFVLLALISTVLLAATPKTQGKNQASKSDLTAFTKLLKKFQRKHIFISFAEYFSPVTMIL